MLRSFAFILTMIGISFSNPVLAHSPYFTQTEQIVLPDGSPGEMRLLHGDGIFFADPVRVVVLDQNKRLLARSSKSRSMQLICRPQTLSCKGYDANRFTVLVLEPATFRSDPAIVPGSGGDDDPIWGLESGDESWGFSSQLASPNEIFHGLYVEATRYTHVALFIFAAGLISGMIFISALKMRKKHYNSKIAFFILFILCLFISLIILFISLTIVFIGDMSVSLTLCGTILGFIAAKFIIHGLRNVRFWSTT